MEKIRRNERMSAMMKILSASPNRIFTLSREKSKNAKPNSYIYPILKYVAAVIILG